MTGYEFMTGKFQDISWLTEQVDIFYKDILVPKGGKSKIQATQDKVVALRKWEPAMGLIQPNMDKVFREVDLFYVPKQLQPGPCIVFPQRDIYGGYARARVKPMYDLEIMGDKVKYAALGMKSAEFAGPGWIGNCPEMLSRIIKSRTCVVVEGSFDYLAARLVAPDAPILSSGTKKLGHKHLDYLRILGVKNLKLLFDNEEKVDGKGGAIDTMYRMQREILDIKTDILLCPAHDPSKCLESYASAFALKRLLSSLNVT